MLTANARNNQFSANSGRRKDFSRSGQTPPKKKQPDFSRGYFKIKYASEEFRFVFRDKIVLDIGSSTGGFTEYALNRGAKKVIAIEKGTNQMRSPLRSHPRVELHEKTDIFSVSIHPSVKKSSSCSTSSPALIIPVPDIILADVSFLSLTKVLKHAKTHLAKQNTDFLVMLKPQFEARPDQLTSGVVKNEKIRRDIIKHFELWLKSHGFTIRQKRDNSLKGKTGNRERFYWLTLEQKKSF